jgi:hypothetical protein
MVKHKLPHQRRFPNASLTVDQRDPTCTGFDLCQSGIQFGKALLTFEEIHSKIVKGSSIKVNLVVVRVFAISSIIEKSLGRSTGETPKVS